MKLRDCPLLKWPPVWNKIEGLGDTPLTGEIGILRSTSLSHVQPDRILYLVMDFDGSSYMGSLLFEYSILCGQVFDLLQQCRGYSIQQIAELDLPHTL
jgi:hypothetical protein